MWYSLRLDIDCADADIQYGFQHVGAAFISFVVASGTIVYGVPPFAVPLVLIVWLHLYVARGVSSFHCRIILC